MAGGTCAPSPREVHVELRRGGASKLRLPIAPLRFLISGRTSSKGGPKVRAPCGKVNLDRRVSRRVTFPALLEGIMGPTYRPRNRRRIHKHGFLPRMKTVWGRATLPAVDLVIRARRSAYPASFAVLRAELTGAVETLT